MSDKLGIPALQRAVRIMGGQSPLARAIGTKQGNVWYWLNVSKKVPAEFAPKIESALSGEVTKQHLRPDLWPADTGA